MEPVRIKCLIVSVISSGFIFTQSCGSQSSTASLSLGGGTTEGVTISNEVSSPAEMQVSDLLMVQFSALQPATIDFSGVEGGSEYYLAVGSLNYGYDTHSVQLQDSLSAAGPSSDIADEAEAESNWEGWSAPEAFHQRLMDIGLDLALDPEAEMVDHNGGLGAKAALSPKAVAVGDTRSFRVLSSLTSVSSYTTVTGKVRCVGSNVIVYVDTEVDSKNPSDLTDSDVNLLCDNFDNQVGLERNWFGSESDIDGDGKVSALLTPQVNRLGSLGGGIITGFFLASDLYKQSSSNAVSNQMEVIYVMTPDSDGIYGLVIPKDFAMGNLLTAVLPHELQHAISYNQHVFQGEGTPETNWLNEGMSHLTEDLVGYGQENYSRGAIFLNNPSSYQLAGLGSPGLGERGASYLFLRFLYEQHSDPESFLWNLFHSRTSGVDNVEKAYDSPSQDFDQFGEFFMRWMVALMMTNQGLSADPRYVYETRTYNSDTEHWMGTCLVCDADDGRGTTMRGPYLRTYLGSESFSLYSSTIRFYDIAFVPDTIDFTTTSTGTLGAVLIRKQ